MRVQMQDKGFLIKEAIGESRSITPEGFLLCRGVAIARTGIQIYDRRELTVVAPDAAGQIRIERLPEEVFRPETIASFEGKPITVYHPEEFVTPENWKKYSVGIVQNVRRGEGQKGHLLLADLLIQSADAIAYANKELPQLSAGYDAEYEETAPGRGLQRNIIGNHVAMLPRGRCGPCCAITDEEPNMSKKRTIFDRIRTALRANDSAAIEAEITEAERAETTQTNDGASTAVPQFGERMTAVETGLADIRRLLTKDADEEAQRQAAAAAAAAATQPTYTADHVREIVARTEILAPGISIPTADTLAAGDTTQQLMRSALEQASSTEVGAECIKPFLMGRELKVLTGDALQGVFNGAAELMRVRNNQRAVRSPAVTKDRKAPMSADDINKTNADFWAGRSVQS
jgi:uncharacterized protein